MDKDQINRLAEKIAQSISSESKLHDLASIEERLETINQRLDRIESSSSISDFKTQIPKPVHPSQDRFAVAEAIVDGLFARDANEKACTFEPGKPCDHCSMCNSRGF